jgi:hypothetical protein
MVTGSAFGHDEVQDSTRDLTASIDQDYITLFTYNKGQDFDKETAGKKASRAIVELFPYNSTAKPKYRTYLTDSGKYHFKTRILSRQARPLRSEVPDYQRVAMLRFSAGPGTPDTLVTHEPASRKRRISRRSRRIQRIRHQQSKRRRYEHSNTQN